MNIFVVIKSDYNIKFINIIIIFFFGNGFYNGFSIISDSIINYSFSNVMFFSLVVIFFNRSVIYNIREFVYFIVFV